MPIKPCDAEAVTGLCWGDGAGFVQRGPRLGHAPPLRRRRVSPLLGEKTGRFGPGSAEMRNPARGRSQRGGWGGWAAAGPSPPRLPPSHLHVSPLTSTFTPSSTPSPPFPPLLPPLPHLFTPRLLIDPLTSFTSSFTPHLLLSPLIYLPSPPR